MTDSSGEAQTTIEPDDSGEGDAEPVLEEATVRDSLVWRLRRGLFLISLFLIAGLAGTLWVLSQVPLPDETPDLSETTFVCAGNVQVCDADSAIASLSAGEYRSLVEFEEIPPVLRNAVIAAEDSEFFRHRGIDPIGVGRAVWADIRTRSASQGGSTITQQYVKNAYLNPERTITRKLREGVIAVKLERELGKEEILKRYLNTIYFGRGAYGVQAASQAYFRKDISGLTLSEAAYLAALIRSPETTDASRTPEVATRRRRSVLDAMVRENMITEAEADAADIPWSESLLVPREESNDLGRDITKVNGTEYFIDSVRQFLIQRYGGTEVFGGGLRVYTTLDPELQRQAFQAATGVLDQPDDPDAAMVVLDDAGHVRAMVGGRDFAESQVNLALGREGGGSGRQPGSAFKPIVLAAALDAGISMRSVFDSTGTAVFPEANNGEDWEVSNYGNADQGVIDLTEAMRVSSNIAFAELAVELGPNEIRRMANKLGVEAELPAVSSLALGAAEVSVMDMATSYSTLANRGERVEPIMVARVEKRVDGEWVLVDDFEADRRTAVVDPAVVDTVNFAMAQVVNNGTGAGAAIDQPAAGKTGTTQDNRDAWFVGFTCKLTTATWVGYSGAPGDPVRFMDNVRGAPVTGGSLPAQIWKRFMEQATVGLDSCAFEEPESLPGRILNRDFVVNPVTPEVPFCNTAASDGVVLDDQGNPQPCRMRRCGPASNNGTVVLNNGGTAPCENRICREDAVNGRMELVDGSVVPCRYADGAGPAAADCVPANQADQVDQNNQGQQGQGQGQRQNNQAQNNQGEPCPDGSRVAGAVQTPSNNQPAPRQPQTPTSNPNRPPTTTTSTAPSTTTTSTTSSSTTTTSTTTSVPPTEVPVIDAPLDSEPPEVIRQPDQPAPTTPTTTATTVATAPPPTPQSVPVVTVPTNRVPAQPATQGQQPDQ